MARTAAETAHILKSFYHTTFDRDSFATYCITWPQLRSLAAVQRLNDSYLKKVSEELSESDYCLVPFNDFLLVTGQQDLTNFRKLPDRLLERSLIDDNEEDDPDIDESEDDDIA